MPPRKAFNPEGCMVPSVWCGEKRLKDVDPSEAREKGVRYIRKGTPYECMKKGIGVGIAQQRKKNLPQNSLQHIKYIGELYEKNFRKNGIRTRTSLVQKMRGMDAEEKSEFLKGILVNSSDKVDYRAYNSVLLYLFSHGVDQDELPRCSKIPLV
jgi:hypothetical protein